MKMNGFFSRLIPIAVSLGLASAASLPPLVEAAKIDESDLIASIINARADVNLPGPDGTTALHWAAYHDDLASADLLLRSGADVNAVTDLAVTPLWTAAQNGSAPMVARLLEAGANPNLAFESGETPLMVASRSGSAESVQLLIDAGANVNATGSRNQTALMWAASQMHPGVVKVLLDAGADIYARSEQWSQVMAVPPHGYLGYNMEVPHGRYTALLFAARSGDLETVKLLTAAGANVNDADAWGVSATVLAAHSGFTDMVEFLLDQGADANAAEAGFGAIHEAVMRRDARLVTALLEHGADPNLPLATWTPTRRSSSDWNFDQGLVGATPFWIAARFTDPTVMRILADHGADPMFVHNADYVAEVGFGFEPRQESTTTLMAAVGLGRAGSAWVSPDRSQQEALTLETVKFLVEAGADVNAKGLDDRTVLDGANRLRMGTVVNYLVQHGAEVRPAEPAVLGRGAR